MLRHIKRGDLLEANANGHVFQGYYFREFRRKGAEGAVMSRIQFEGFFGGPQQANGEHNFHEIDGIPVVMDPKLSPDEIRFYVADKEIGRITNLYVPPEAPSAKPQTSTKLRS